MQAAGRRAAGRILDSALDSPGRLLAQNPRGQLIICILNYSHKLIASASASAVRAQGHQYDLAILADRLEVIHLLALSLLALRSTRSALSVLVYACRCGYDRL